MSHNLHQYSFLKKKPWELEFKANLIDSGMILREYIYKGGIG